MIKSIGLLVLYFIIGYIVVTFLYSVIKPKKADTNKEETQDVETDTCIELEWYQILEVDKTSTLEEIKKSYRNKMKEYHPDRVSGLGQEFIKLAEEKAKETPKKTEEVKIEKTEEKKSPEIKNIQNLISYKIVKVIDWDTIKIFDENWEKESVRMIWIDTPESYKTRFWYKECFWDEASNYLKKIIWDSEKVQVEIDKTQWNKWFDRYWRLLWYVFLNWENLNEKMIKDWYAWEFTYQKHFYKYQKEFKAAEKFASKNDFWLWAKDTCNWKRVKIEE